MIFKVILNISDNNRNLNLFETGKVPLKARITFYSGDFKDFLLNNILVSKQIQTDNIFIRKRDILILNWL